MMGTEQHTHVPGKRADLLLFAYALQSMTPIPFRPGLPIPIIGLILFFVVLIRQAGMPGTLREYGRGLLVLVCTLAAAQYDDVLLRFALCLVSFLILRLESLFVFRWYLLWFLYHLAFTLITPAQYLLRWIAEGLSYAAWAAAFGWMLPRQQFHFGPDLAQVPLLMAWLLFCVAHIGTPAMNPRRHLFLLSGTILLLLLQLNLFNTSFDPFTIDVWAVIDALVIPLLFILPSSRPRAAD